jgi:hypothetical protein
MGVDGQGRGSVLALCRRSETRLFQNCDRSTIDDLAPTAVYKAAKESFKPDVIVASWKRTGMWPADFDLIRSKGRPKSEPARGNHRLIARQCRHYPGYESH